MLRIAIDCRMIGSGGIGSFISELIPLFLENNECLLIGTHEQCQDFLRLANVEFCFCDIKPFSLKEMYSFPKEVLNKINSYQCYFSPYCNIPGGIKVPVFSTIHDVVFLDVPELTGYAGRVARKIIYQRSINKSKAVFTVSEFSKSRIMHHLSCKKELSVVYNSAPSYLTHTDENEIEPAAKSGILFVGNIKKHKGLSTLVDAFELARSKGLKEKLIIVGNPDNFRTGDSEICQRLAQFSNDEVCFTGKISNSQLKQLYKSSKVLVQPSLYEGFGMPPLEAMTVGTPAIISDIPVFKEIYDGLPVTFFKTSDSSDLCAKLMEAEAGSPEIDSELVKNKYSYKNSSNLILDIIKKYL